MGDALGIKLAEGTTAGLPTANIWGDMNLKPVVEVKSRRVGGATYQVPVEVRPERRTALAMRWLISYSRDRNEKSMAEKLAAETLAAAKGEGNAVKKREDTGEPANEVKGYKSAAKVATAPQFQRPTAPVHQAMTPPAAPWAKAA
jgi:hypothetical protein